MAKATELASLVAELATAGAAMHTAVESVTAQFAVSHHPDRDVERYQRIAQALADDPVDLDPALLNFGTTGNPSAKRDRA